jgi:hypothetical protein
MLFSPRPPTICPRFIYCIVHLYMQLERSEWFLIVGLNRMCNKGSLEPGLQKLLNQHHTNVRYISALVIGSLAPPKKITNPWQYLPHQFTVESKVTPDLTTFGWHWRLLPAAGNGGTTENTEPRTVLWEFPCYCSFSYHWRQVINPTNRSFANVLLVGLPSAYVDKKSNGSYVPTVTSCTTSKRAELSLVWVVFHEFHQQCTQLHATSLRPSLPPTQYIFWLCYFTSGKLLQSIAATETSLISCLLNGEVCWCGVLARDRWSCCMYRRAEIEGVVEHASRTILANTEAAIVRAHRPIL